MGKVATMEAQKKKWYERQWLRRWSHRRGGRKARGDSLSILHPDYSEHPPYSDVNV